jgi:hypothetical protein
MTMNPAGALLVGLVAVLAGCATFDAENFKKTDLRRAAFELGCKPEQLTVTDVAEREVGVTGCGKRAVYVIAPNGGWVNNGGVQPAP